MLHCLYSAACCSDANFCDIFSDAPYSSSACLWIIDVTLMLKPAGLKNLFQACTP